MTKKQKKKNICKGCGHTAKFHYVSNYGKTKGMIFCSKDNCFGWQHCDQKGWDLKMLEGKHK